MRFYPGVSKRNARVGVGRRQREIDGPRYRRESPAVLFAAPTSAQRRMLMVIPVR